MTSAILRRYRELRKDATECTYRYTARAYVLDLHEDTSVGEVPPCECVYRGMLNAWRIAVALHESKWIKVYGSVFMCRLGSGADAYLTV